MNELKKPPICWAYVIKKLLISGVFLAVGALLIFLWVSKCVHFRDVRQKVVTLDSVVYHVDENYDSDDGWEYDVYVKFTYNDQLYEMKYVTSIYSEWMDRIGETIQVTVNPDNPTEQLDEIMEGPFFAVFFGLPIFCVGVAIFPSSVRFSYVEFYGLNSEAIRADIVREVKSDHSWVGLLAFAIGLISSGIYAIDIDGIYVTGIIFGIPVLVLSVFVATFHFTRLRTAWDAQISVSHCVVKDKKTYVERINDPEEPDKFHYEVLYAIGTEERWSKVSKRQYGILQINDRLVRVSAGIPHVLVEYKYDPESGGYFVC